MKEEILNYPSLTVKTSEIVKNYKKIQTMNEMKYIENVNNNAF